MSKKVGVLGAGSWATALSRLLARLGHLVRVWSIFPEQVREINETRENSQYLPGVAIPPASRPLLIWRKLWLTRRSFSLECLPMLFGSPAQSTPYLPAKP